MRRWTAALLAACGALLWLSSCSDGPYRDYMWPAQTVNGQSYVVLWTRPALAPPGTQGNFRIYRCISPDFSTWQPLDEKRTGPVFGTFVYRDETGERLGLFHEERVSLWRFDQGEAKVDTLVLPFKWTAETAAQVEDTLYLFGGDVDWKQARDTGIWNGRISASCYDGKEFKVLDPGPVFKPGPGGFSLQAVTHKDKIYLFWRCAQVSEGLDLEPSISFSGPLLMASFDGLIFDTEVREFTDLPKGHVEVWSDGQELHAVVQPQEPGSGRTPQLKLFTLGLNGTVKDEAMVPFQAPLSLHFKYFNVTRVSAEGRTAFLRSNSQEFEVWEPVSGRWNMRPDPAGLPKQELMFLLLSLLFLCVSLVAMGVGMAIRRRRQMHWVLERLRPQDVLAPLSLRISAYLMDVGIAVALTMGLCAATGLQAPRWSQFFFGLDVVPTYGGVYLAYFTLTEWRWGRTAGKWLLGLQVVTDQGEPLNLWASFVRNLVGFFERHIAPAAIIAVLMTPRAQRVGDLMGRTLVVQRIAFARYREQRQKADAEKALREAAANSGASEAAAAHPEDPPSSSDGDTKA